MTDDHTFVFDDTRQPRIYCDKASVNAIRIFREMPVSLVDHAVRADMLWIRRGFSQLYNRLSRYQLLNHIPGEKQMVDKGRLTQALQTYSGSQTEFPFNLEDFYQQTYCLYLKDQAEDFLAGAAVAGETEDLWILKPTDLSEGEGIKIISARSEAKEFVTGSADGNSSQRDSYIAQKYIRRPLLLQQRKSEIRIYWIIACLEPLQVMMFHEGTVRLNSLPFRLADFDNQLVHITNVKQQYNHPDFDPNTVLKWSFDDLDAYLADTLQLTSADFIDSQLKPQLKQILAFVVRATQQALISTPSNGLFFGLFGADIILDDQLKPWLTEIQKGPSLSFDDSIKRKVIAPLIQKTAMLEIDLQARFRRHEPIVQSDCPDGFEWVINEAC